MEGQFVMMPVRCMGKICRYCKWLKIDTEVMDLTDSDGKDSYEINLRCRSVGRCAMIRETLEQEEK